MPQVEPRAWPAGGGTIGASIRAADWAATSLGAADGWPQYLKTSIEILLHAPLPMLLLWGAEGMLFVNDTGAALADALAAPPGSPSQNDWSLGGLLDAECVHGAYAGTAHVTSERLVMLKRSEVTVPARLRIAYTPVHDELGAPAGVLVILGEATPADAPHTPQELTSAILEGISEPFYVIDAQWRLTYLNRKVEQLWNRSRDDLLGSVLWDVFPGYETTVSYRMHMQAMRERATVTWETFSLVLQIWIEAIAFPIGSGLAVTFRDISARREAEDALRQGEANFVKAFASSPAALLITRLADGRYLELNDAYSTIVGYARDELIGHVTTEFNIYLDTADRQAIVDQLLTRGSVRDFETRIRHRSGAIRHVIANQEQITFNGEPCILTHILDITERKRLEEALQTAFQRFQVILASLYGGILVLRGDDRVEFANQAFCDLFELAEDPAVLLGLHASEIIQRIARIYVDSPAALARIQAIVATAQPVRGEEIAIIGDRTYLRDFIPIVIDGQRYGRVWHHVDITALKQVERALETERALLAQRVAERTADLSLANAELVRAARVKDEFLSNMSHELRTPLNAILGRAELLREQIYGPLTPKQETAIQSIEEAGQHLLALINDILDLAKMEVGKLGLDLALLEVDVVGHAAIRMVEQQALTRQIAITSIYDSRIKTIIADARRLKQILVNLLANAVKFTSPGGKVGLEVQADPTQQVVIFTVWDTGIGIAPEKQAHLFQPFVQADSSLSRSYEGTGLGLALVRRLTELHGGRVTLESSPGQGSRFSIILPWITKQADVGDRSAG